MLAAFIGFEVIRRVSPLLHTPLMSLTNALDAIAVFPIERVEVDLKLLDVAELRVPIDKDTQPHKNDYINQGSATAFELADF